MPNDMNLRSAVLLLHQYGGAKPINVGGKLSGAVDHAVEYDAREGRWADKGGVDREMTDDDIRLSRSVRVGDELGHALEYDAREGDWQDKGAERMEDCSLWNERGPVSSEEVRRDMGRAGGAFLRSVVSVDRRHAAKLGLDSKEAMQELLRGTWTKMMAGTSAFERPEDVRWCAAYHTDAEHSLHCHIITWSAAGNLKETWNPSAPETRHQKAVLYEKAYASVRLELEMEKDYLRTLLPLIARAEIGDKPSEFDLERVYRLAERAGVECSFAGERTMREEARPRLMRKLAEVADLSRGARGRVSRNFPAMSKAGDVIQLLKKESPEYARAEARLREIVDEMADGKGLAVKLPDYHDPEFAPKSQAELEFRREMMLGQPDEKIRAEQERVDNDEPGRKVTAEEIARHERRDYVWNQHLKRVMDSVKREIVVASTPEGRDMENARKLADDARKMLVHASLRNPERNLGIDKEAADRLRAIYQDALRERLSDPHAPAKIDQARLAEAAKIIAASPAAAVEIDKAASDLERISNRAISESEAREIMAERLEERIANMIEWRLQPGHVDLMSMSHDRIALALERKMAKDFVRQALHGRETTLGMPLSTHEQMLKEVEKVRLEVRELLKDESRHGSPVQFKDLSPDGRAALSRAALLITGSPEMAKALDRAVLQAEAANPEARSLDRSYVDASAQRAVEAKLLGQIERDEVGGDREVEMPGLDMAGFAAMLASRLVRDQMAERGGPTRSQSKSRPPRHEEMRDDLSEPPRGRHH